MFVRMIFDCKSAKLFLNAYLGSSFPPGLTRVNSWSALHMPGLYPVPFWASLLVHLGLFRFTMVMLVRVPTHRCSLAGVAQVDSELTCFSSRFPRLMTSRPQGDDAFPSFTKGWGLHPTSNSQLSRGWLAIQSPCCSSPGLQPVSSKRIARKEIGPLFPFI
jgi:hypothetical protein